MKFPTRLTDREIDALEDARILAVSRAQGVYGRETASKHANTLMHRAINAFGRGDVDEAVWLAERELKFNCRIFGFHHRFTISALLTLKALRTHAVVQQVASISINKDAGLSGQTHAA